MAMSSFIPWKDPRLAAGIALVAGGGLAGSLLLGGESTVPILRASQPIAAGTVLEASQFVVDELPDKVGEGYVRLGEIPADAVAAHSISAGDLLARSALEGVRDKVDLSVPLLSDPPSSIGVGAEVEIWRVRSAQFDNDAEAHRIVTGAVLVSIDMPESVSVGGSRVQVRVSPADVPDILEVLGTQDGLVIVGGVAS